MIFKRLNPDFNMNFAEATKKGSRNAEQNSLPERAGSFRESTVKTSSTEVVCVSPQSGRLFTAVVDVPKERKNEGETSEDNEKIRREVRNDEIVQSEDTGRMDVENDIEAYQAELRKVRNNVTREVEDESGARKSGRDVQHKRSKEKRSKSGYYSDDYSARGKSRSHNRHQSSSTCRANTTSSQK